MGVGVGRVIGWAAPLNAHVHKVDCGWVGVEGWPKQRAEGTHEELVDGHGGVDGNDAPVVVLHLVLLHLFVWLGGVGGAVRVSVGGGD